MLRRYGLALAVGGFGSALFMTAPTTILRLLGVLSCIGGAFLIATSAGRSMAASPPAQIDPLDMSQPDDDLGPTALRAAITNDELILHYQPVVAGSTLQVSGLEALLRWQHPTRGLLMPATFIGLAEETGIIGALGEWALRRACLDGRRWPGLFIAVNVSPVQVRRGDFVARLAAILADTGFAADRLQIELTESVVIEECGAGGADHRRFARDGHKCRDR